MLRQLHEECGQLQELEPLPESFASPVPDDDELPALGLQLPLVLDEDFLKLFRWQRTHKTTTPSDPTETPLYPIGGFVQRVDMTKDGMATRIIHRWPEDSIGERINPFREVTP
jgi:hypothetical protein